MNLHIKLLIGTLAFVSAYAPSHEFHNATPFDLRAELDVKLGFDKHEDLPKYQKKEIPVGAHLLRGIKVKGTIGQHPLQDLVEERKVLGLGHITYYIFCMPVIERKDIPGGYSDQITKVKFYLVRLPRGSAYPGGLVAESKLIEIASHRRR